MNLNSGNNKDKFDYLRQLAEERVSAEENESEYPVKLKPEEIKSLVREIKILRASLEIQSEELVRIQNELTGIYFNVVNFYNNAPLGFVTIDVNGKIKSVNDFFLSLFSVQRHGLSGRQFESLLLSSDKEKYNECLRKNYLTGNVQSCEVGMKTSDSQNIFVRLTVSGVNKEYGEDNDYRIILQDITLQKKAEQKIKEYEQNLEKMIEDRTLEYERKNKFLEQEKTFAEKISRMKTIFLANISHELRTPMVGILGYSEIMMNELKDEEYVKMARRIQSSGTRLLETLNMILDFAKTETEKITLNFESIDVSEIVNDVAELFRIIASKKGLPLIVRGTDKKLNVVTDERLFRQILNNLINNAVKYTNEGSIEVTLKKHKTALMLSVKDSGIGIHKDRLDGIFEEFGQVSDGYNKEYIGSGLGLTLVKRYVGLLNGEIRVESEFGKGSQFVVTLPLVKLSGSKTVSSAATSKPVRHKILIVEDDELNYSLLKSFVEDEFDVSIATNLENAVKAAQHNKYELILLDIDLGSDETGIDVLRELRELEGYNRVPAIAVTAYSLKGDRDFFMRSGMNDYISKPFTRKELIRKINKLLSKK